VQTFESALPVSGFECGTFLFREALYLRLRRIRAGLSRHPWRMIPFSGGRPGRRRRAISMMRFSRGINAVVRFSGGINGTGSLWGMASQFWKACLPSII
jgi:hypothetical protein